MKREVLKRCLIFTFLLFILLVGYYCYKESKDMVKINCVTFNKESGFYSESINIKLHKNVDLPIGSKLYYTLDGNDPTKDSNKYNSSIKLELIDGETKVYPLKVIAYYKGQYSDISEKTYVLDKDIKSNDINIISITSDEKNLYDYETGIMVKGKTYDQNVLIDKNTFKGNYSNRGDDWLRESHIAMFDTNSNLILDQQIRLGISGSSSTQKDVKSLKINYDIDDNKKFKINFYDKYFVSNTSLVNEYNSLRLRSGSQDIKTGNIRSSLTSRLCTQSNFDGCQTTERTLVFLNGEFYGVFDIQQTYSNSTLKKMYSLPSKGTIDKFKSNEKNSFAHYDLKKYFTSDLSDENNRKRLEEKVDMDNYILYISMQLLMNNCDWPRNNFEMWKYTNGYDGNNVYTDGRYRFLLYDLDATYRPDGTMFFDVDDNFKEIMENGNNENSPYNSTFVNLVKSRYYRDKYVMMTQDLLNTTFQEDNVLNVATEEYNKIDNSYKKYYGEKDYSKTIKGIEDLYYGIEIVDDRLLNNFKEYFGLEETHTVNVKANEGIQINFSNQELYQNQEYNNSYYRDIDLRYNYKEYPGYTFEYWLVNSEKVYDKELVIESEKYRDYDEINIEVVAKYNKKDNHLLIVEMYPKGYSDWIKIKNTGKESINIKDYYLSDRENKLKKYQLPSIVLKPTESIIINGNKNYYSIGDYICNFNMSQSEKIVLSKDNKIVDYVIVPRSSEIETYGRYDNSNTFKFFMNENDERKVIKKTH